MDASCRNGFRSPAKTCAKNRTKRYSPRGYNAAAWLYATCPKEDIRNGGKALELALKGCDLSEWRDGGVVDTLAAAEAEAGDFDEAVKYERQAIDLTKAANASADTKAWKIASPSTSNTARIARRQSKSIFPRFPFRRSSRCSIKEAPPRGARRFLDREVGQHRSRWILKKEVKLGERRPGKCEGR